MAAAAPTSPAIAVADLPELLDLIGGADTVELKLTVPEPDQRSAIDELGLDPTTRRSGRSSSSTRLI